MAKKIGAIAKPDDILFTADLPKTRSGKIMRRLLRDVARGNVLGDVTTLAERRDRRRDPIPSGNARRRTEAMFGEGPVLDGVLAASFFGDARVVRMAERGAGRLGARGAGVARSWTWTA